MGNHAEIDANKQKWNPQVTKASKNLAKSNFTLGLKNEFYSEATSKAEFKKPNVLSIDDSSAKRVELLNELRKSHLPSGQEVFPNTTAQDSFKGAVEREQ